MTTQRLNSFVGFSFAIMALLFLSAATDLSQSRSIYLSGAIVAASEPVPASAPGLRARTSRVVRPQGDQETAIKKRITVEGNTGLNWLDTRIEVSAGDLVRLAATGEVDVKAEWGSHGPEGTTKFSEQPPGYYPVESKTRYGLAARITSSKGKELQKWSYGDAREMLVKAGGRLWLTVNDDAPDGNEGEYDVNITIVLKKN